jgi:hypothetical protein
MDMPLRLADGLTSLDLARRSQPKHMTPIH